MSNLVNKINSNYIENRNALNKRKGKIITVYVENEEDIPFWKFIFEKNNINTKIYPASNRSLERGKDTVLKHLSKAGEYLVLCVDSDYDYIMQNYSEKSRAINTNPFIFQTYTYAIENYRCYAQSLNFICLTATQNDNKIFDFEYFFEAYSNIIYDLFVYSIYYHKKYYGNQTQNPLTISEFSNAVKILKRANITNNGKEELKIVRDQVSKKINSLLKIDEKEINQLKNELSKLGINKHNTYLFIHGHTLFKNVVMMFLPPIFEQLKKEKYYDIKQKAKNEIQKNNKINEFRKLTHNNVEYLLKNNTDFLDCPLYNKIQFDINQYFEVINKYK